MLDIKTLATQAAEHHRATGKKMSEAVEAVLMRYSFTESQFVGYKREILSECGRRGGKKTASKTRKKTKKEPFQTDMFK